MNRLSKSIPMLAALLALGVLWCHGLDREAHAGTLPDPAAAAAAWSGGTPQHAAVPAWECALATSRGEASLAALAPRTDGGAAALRLAFAASNPHGSAALSWRGSAVFPTSPVSLAVLIRI